MPVACAGRGLCRGSPVRRDALHRAAVRYLGCEFLRPCSMTRPMLRRAAVLSLLVATLAPAAEAQNRPRRTAEPKTDAAQQRVDTIPVRPTTTGAATVDSSVTARYRDAARRIVEAATRDSSAWHRLAELTDTFGPRLSGTQALEKALDWTVEQMTRDGFDRVWTEPVMVPVWVRGEESATLTVPYVDRLPMLGLGGSVGTPPEGVEAEVMVVSTFAELTARCAEARGKIVLFNAPFVTYGQTVAYRSGGGRAASQCGAVAALVRSVASGSMATPHTGATRYTPPVADGATPPPPDVTPIPIAAITVEDAGRLHRMARRGTPLRLRLKMEARTLPDAPSRNVLAEIRGSEHPEQVVVMGGHTDSWDVGTGAMDDAGGVVAAWEALRLLKTLGLRPRRTIRVVGWTNEENGLRGGTEYARAHAAELPNHVLAIESDGGTFQPLGFGFAGKNDAFALLEQVGPLLAPFGAGRITRGGGGADIGPMAPAGVPQMSLNVDGRRYFYYHHTEADAMDVIDPVELARCAAAMAIMAYVVADMPERLPHGSTP